MAIEQPQVQVFQQFRQYPSEITDPLRVCLIGPEYKLHRYSGGATGEKVKAGSYSSVGGNAFTWDALGRAAGGVVDQAYTKLYLENALLEYYRNAAGYYVIGHAQVFTNNFGSSSSSSMSSSSSYGGDPDGTASVLSVVGKPNQVYVTGVNLKGNGTTYPLNAALYSRDVQVGDHARVSAVISGVTTTTDATVTGLIADAVASNVSAAANGVNNAANNSSANSASSITKGGTVNAVTITPVATNYNGLTTGQLQETYTVKVRTGSTGGDARTAVLDIISASGLDNVSGVTFPSSSFTTSLSLGTLGATFSFSMGGVTDLVAGQTFSTTITQQFYIPVAAANTGDNYTGTADTTYVVTVIRGGDVLDSAQPVLSVSTTNGVDSGAPITVGAVSTAYAVGNYGATITFTVGTGSLRLRKGDQYYIPVTAAGKGAYRTLVLDKNLDPALQSTSTQSIDLTLSLCIVSNQILTSTNNYVTSYTQNSSGVTLTGGITLFNSNWRSGATALPLIGADVYVHWRELIQDHSDAVYSCDTLGDLPTTITTPIDPDNPLGYAADKALINANGTSIRFVTVATNDQTGYLNALDKIETREDCYFIVPLTTDSTVLDDIVGHVDAMSTPTVGRWRVAILSSPETNPTTIVKYESDNSTLVAATTSAKVVTLTNTSTTSFITAGVKAGDNFRINFGTDQSGAATYDSFVVDTVDSAQQLTLTVAPSPAIGTAQPIEIWRTLNTQGLADQISANCGIYGRSRVWDIQPSRIKSGGVEVDGIYLASAVAGLKSGVVPHQGLTNLPILGFDNADKIVKRFNLTQTDQLANAGVWVVTHDLKTGQVYTRQQITTDPTDVNTREASVVTNVDSISFYFKNLLKKFIGRSNVTPSLTALIETEIEAGISYLKSAGFAENIGGQLIDATLNSIAPHPTLKDRLVVTLTLQIPYPLNILVVNLII